MIKKKQVCIAIAFFIVICSAFAFNRTLHSEKLLLPPPTVDFTFDTNACSFDSVSFVSIVSGDGGFDYE